MTLLDAWAQFVHRRRWTVLAWSALILIGSVVALARGGPLSTGLIDGIESDRGLKEIERGLGRPAGSTFTIIFTSKEWVWPDPRFVDAVRAALAPAAADPRVFAVETPADVPAALAADRISASKHRVVAQVTMREPFVRAAVDYPEVRGLIRPHGLDAIFTGFIPFKDDLDHTLEVDLIHAEAVSVPLALIVLLGVFGTLVAALLPIGVGGLACVGGVAIVMLLSHVTTMGQYTINVATLIGLGVGIDYSLFIVSRYKDELGGGASTCQALQTSLRTAGRTVLFSGMAVGIGLAGLLFFPHSYLSSMGLAGAIVVGLAVASALTFLPALLAILGEGVYRGKVPFVHGGSATSTSTRADGGIWRKVAHMVMERPIQVLVPTLALMLLVGIPFLRLQMAGIDVSVLPADVEARRGDTILQDELPAMWANRAVAVVTFPDAAFTPARVGALVDLSRKFAALPGVRKVESLFDLDPRVTREQYQALYQTPSLLLPPDLRFAINAASGRGVVVFSVVTGDSPDSDGARALVKSMRMQRQVADGALLVTGQTAADLDGTEFIVDHTPGAVGFVMLMTCIVLFMAFRSILLPIKAVMMNLISITASFGAMVWIFQDGHLATFLGFVPRPLDPTLPVLLFCSVFGLSMDYEVLLLGRMREEWERSGDNSRAVAEGLERSGRLITSAAAIMVSVFLAFALARVVVVKAMGVGMALAVLLDATLVRLLIVPATMRLFGDLNWWAPRWLKRLF
jgi:RND superfamily putative drug exporter